MHRALSLVLLLAAVLAGCWLTAGEVEQKIRRAPGGGGDDDDRPIETADTGEPREDR